MESDLSILLIEDEADAARLILHVLGKAGAKPITADWAQDLQSGLQRLVEQKYDAVLLDLNLPDSSGFETFACMRQKTPDQAVIVLTGHEDEALALQAVRAGADEYLIKSEIRDRYLSQRIRYAVERSRLKSQGGRQDSRNGRVFTFLGAKGGVGTTTVAVNLAATLARAGKTVIAVELMPEYGSFAALLQHTPSWDISTLLKSTPESMTRETAASCLEQLAAGFRALCGPQRPEDYSPISAEHTRALLGLLRTMADYILIDAPAGFSPAVEEAVQHSTMSMLVAERNPLGLHAASAKIPLLQATAGRPGGIGLIIVNKTPFIEFLSPGEFSRRLGCGVIGVVPPQADPAAAGAVLAPDRREDAFAIAMQDLSQRLTSGGERFLAA